MRGFVLLGLIILCGMLCDSAGAARQMSFHATTPREARGWQAAAREKLFALMMGGSRPESVPLDPQILHQTDVSRGGYTLEEISIQTLPDRRAHAWVIMPKHPRGKVPAVLALHGHGGSGEQIVQGESLYWYGRALAEMGYAVIAPDIGSHDLQHKDWTLMGERIWDALRCIDYILSRPEVDPSGIAVAGLSLGGESTMYVAALDERVKIADSSGWLTTTENMRNGHCTCWQFPGLEENFDFSDIFSLVAPRRLICEIGMRETAPGGFPVSIAKPAFDEVLKAYRVFGAEDQATLDIHHEGHVFVGREFWTPLKHVMGKPDPWLPRDGSDEAARRGEIARRAFSRALGVLDGWWAIRDPKTNLTPRRLDQNVWAPNDNAADMLPFLYMTAYLLAPEKTKDLDTVFKREHDLTNRIGAMPDWYDIPNGRFVYDKPDMYRVIFGSAEYCKDGLIPMTDLMGYGPWTQRMMTLTQAVMEHAPVKSDYGMLPADDTEVNGDMLQVLCRIYCMTREPKYLEWAERIGDAYCLEVLPKNGGLPTHRWDFSEHKPINDVLSLNDHGNEIIGGLSELLVASRTARSSKAGAYERALGVMFRRLLDKGRNSDGIWFGTLKASTGEATGLLPPDTWGYALTGAATYGMVSGDPAMRAAVVRALKNIDQPQYHYWIGGADSFADSIESGLLLLNYHWEPIAHRWLENVLPAFLAYQKASGIVEGWYGDGNYARTALMVGLYYTQGVMCRPRQNDLRFGAVRDGDSLVISISADKDWQGKLTFDTARHKRNLNLPINYPRLNEFPEWFTVEPGRTYTVRIGDCERTVDGRELIQGLDLKVTAGKPQVLHVGR